MHASTWKTPNFGGSSFWILEDYCIFFYSTFCAFLSWHLRLVTQNASSISKEWCLWNSWFQRYYTVGYATAWSFQLASRSLQWVTSESIAILLFLFCIFCSTPADTLRPAPTTTTSRLKGLFRQILKCFQTIIRSLTLDPWSLWCVDRSAVTKWNETDRLKSNAQP